MVGGMAGPVTAAPPAGSPSYKTCPDEPPPNANAGFTQDQTAQCESSGTGNQGAVTNRGGGTPPEQQ
jgi:hypothetical protein